MNIIQTPLVNMHLYYLEQESDKAQNINLVVEVISGKM